MLNFVLLKCLFIYVLIYTYFLQGRETLEETLNSKLSGASEEQRKEVCKMVCDHFDPNVTIEPEVDRKPLSPRKSNRRSNAKDKEQTVSSDIPTTPDTTASNTSVSSPSKSNGVETPQDESPSHKPTPRIGNGRPEQIPAPKEAKKVEK